VYREEGYTALSRHREQARFYVVSPGSVERALPGLEPDRKALAEASRRCSRQAAARAACGQRGGGARPDEARPVVADPHESRLGLVADDKALGERPSSFAVCEAWAREAAQFVAAGTPTLDPTIQPVDVDDLGMDL
jgi:hypothetical protein